MSSALSVPSILFTHGSLRSHSFLFLSHIITGGALVQTLVRYGTTTFLGYDTCKITIGIRVGTRHLRMVDNKQIRMPNPARAAGLPLSTTLEPVKWSTDGQSGEPPHTMRGRVLSVLLVLRPRHRCLPFCMLSPRNAPCLHPQCQPPPLICGKTRSSN